MSSSVPHKIAAREEAVLVPFRHIYVREIVTYIYIYIHTHAYMYVYIYIYIVEITHTQTPTHHKSNESSQVSLSAFKKPGGVTRNQTHTHAHTPIKIPIARSLQLGVWYMEVVYEMDTHT